MHIPCRCSSFSSCASLPLNKFRNLLRLEWAPVYHVKGWGKFKRHFGDFCTGADITEPLLGLELGFYSSYLGPSRWLESCTQTIRPSLILGEEGAGPLQPNPFPAGSVTWSLPSSETKMFGGL